MMLTLVVALQLSGLEHCLHDVWQALTTTAFVHQACPDDETGNECPPGCPDCHCAHIAHAAVPTQACSVQRAADLSPALGPLPLRDFAPPSPQLPALFRPPRA